MHRRAFTLIELLVVVAIIAVMVSVLLPALANAREAARSTKELSAARMLMIAHHLYSEDFNGELIPAYLTSVSGLQVAIPNGSVVTGEPLRRWPWRLMGYIDHGIEGSILVNDMEPWGSIDYATSFVGWAYEVSLYPSLGMNMYWVGGTENTWAGFKSRHTRRIDQAASPGGLITFASARYYAIGGAFPDRKSGYFWVGPASRPPANPGWSPTRYREDHESSFYGHVHPRHHNLTVVTARLDGHAQYDDFNTLRTDMRLWSDEAYRANDPHYAPSWTP